MRGGRVAPRLSLVSLGGHDLSTPYLLFLPASRALMSSCFFACSASRDAGGQDGLRRGGRPSSAAGSIEIFDRHQPAMRARPPLVPTRAPANRQEGGFKSLYRYYSCLCSLCRRVNKRMLACLPAELGSIGPHAM